MEIVIYFINLKAELELMAKRMLLMMKNDTYVGYDVKMFLQ